MREHEKIEEKLNYFNLTVFPLYILDYILEMKEGLQFAMIHTEIEIKEELKNLHKFKMYTAALVWSLCSNNKEYNKIKKQYRLPEWPHEKSLDMLYGRYQTQKQMLFLGKKIWIVCPRCGRRILKYEDKIALCPVCFEALK